MCTTYEETDEDKMRTPLPLPLPVNDHHLIVLTLIFYAGDKYYMCMFRLTDEKSILVRKV